MTKARNSFCSSGRRKTEMTVHIVKGMRFAMDQSYHSSDLGGQGGYPGQYTYNVDMVLCIDATKSMEPVIQMVKENARQLPDDVLRKAGEKTKAINRFRIKLLLFRDYLADGEYAIEMTDFMEMPEQKQLFCDMVNTIEAIGGGDEPEDGLEALAYAMASNWQKPAGRQKCRQIIVVWTDASTHELGFGKAAPNYDPKLPADFGELTDWWGDDPDSPSGKMHYESKRLLLFAPDAKYWSTIARNWDNVIPVKTIAGQGLREKDYEEVLKLLVETLDG